MAASAGAVVTTLVGVVAGAAVGERSQDQHWTRDQVARACVRLLEESSQVFMGLVEMERARPASVPQGVVVPTALDWRPWNQALNMINLVADPGIVDAALALDEQIWRMHTAIRRGFGWTRPGWTSNSLCSKPKVPSSMLLDGSLRAMAPRWIG
ncbi:hypothetical protein [Streptomyces sp. NPDC049040]|uniref:hypothetical protein n=1 Tax=Streptomyces sp. NPDC049040 TaxID=3365593 RepID=UPI0037208188